MSKIFENFTNLYELSKTLRFELRPVGKLVDYVDEKTGEIKKITMTEKMLLENGVFEKDEEIQIKYQETKKYFDRLHREFTKESLMEVPPLNLNEYTKLLNSFKKITKETSSIDKKKAETALKNEEKRLRKEIVILFNKKAKEWSGNYPGLKNKDLKILNEEAVFQSLLKRKYGKEDSSFLRDENGTILKNETGENISIFDGWKNFNGYFTKFFETRKNFYKDDGTSTAIATRVVDQNLRRFSDNIDVIDFIQRKYPNISFSEIEEIYGFDVTDIKKLIFYFNNCLLQDGIDKYNEDFIGRIKSIINEYRQINKVKIPYPKILDNQILSEREKFIDEIENDDNLILELKNLLDTGKEKTQILKNLFNNLFDDTENSFNLAKIYLSKKGFETISRKWTNETFLWEENLAIVFGENGIKLSKKKDAGFSFPDFISLEILKKSLEKIYSDGKNDNFWKDKYREKLKNEKDIWRQFLNIFNLEFKDIFNRKIQTEKGEEIVGYEIFEDNLSRLLSKTKFNKDLEIIKGFADSLLSVYQFSKYFALEKSKNWDTDTELDTTFYNHPKYGFFDKYYQDSFEKIITPYNLIRNYLTKKLAEEAHKWKLNFENSTLADGWDKNKEIANSSVILKKEEKYYLALMKKGHSSIFTDKNKEEFLIGIADGKYEKMIYKLLPGANKMLPKVFFSKSKIAFFGPSEDILNIRNYSSHTKGGNPQKGFNKKDFNLEDCHKIIDFFKKSLYKHEEWKDFNFSFSETSSYKDMSGFYREVEQGGYKISFQDISEKYINEKNEAGELYLFQIKNKDWNDGSNGAKNLHTLYFENLFSDHNKDRNFIFKLNGQAEIFYRQAIKNLQKEKIETKENKIIIEKGEEIFHKKRYTENKIFFHVPITLNRGKGRSFYFNRDTNKSLANKSKINIIGIDRGEKHLAYYSVINQKEEILESGSLNLVGKDGNKKTIDYHQKLEQRAKDREQSRKDWKSIEGIKDLKRGYISQVVRKLADLAIDHNAIVVFEDLNMRFKQIRGGIEKSIYQQLEKALIEKLNFLVNKGEKNPKDAGHLLKAYQLAAPFETFKKMGKQTGIIFYTQASYTSKIDPVTGWRPNLYLKYKNAKQAKEDILKFNKIEFANGHFDFNYDLKKFINGDKVRFPSKTRWMLCSCVERFYWNRKLNNNKGGYEHYEDLTDKFKQVFTALEIDIKKDILSQIKSIETKGNEKFFSDFIFLFKLICQIRNTDEKAKDKDKQDFILSPIHPFFDSRKDNGQHLPKNGDDNGAYNIARKGVIILERISEFENMSEIEKEKLKYPDLFVSNQDWDNFIQK